MGAETPGKGFAYNTSYVTVQFWCEAIGFSLALSGLFRYNKIVHCEGRTPPPPYLYYERRSIMPIGFIQNELDLKLLVLYIMDRVASPITFLQLFELALCDAGVDYFSLTQAVNHMVATGQLSLEEDHYVITEKGRRNSQICQSSLPRSIQLHCDENLVKVNEALRREAQVRSHMIDNGDGTVTLCLTLEDNTSPLFHLALLAPTSDQAQHWAQVFQADPAALYLNIIQLLEQPKEAQL